MGQAVRDVLFEADAPPQQEVVSGVVPRPVEGVACLRLVRGAAVGTQGRVVVTTTFIVAITSLQERLQVVLGRSRPVVDGVGVARQETVAAVGVVRREGNQLQVVLAVGAVGGRTHLCDSGQQQPEQDGTNGDDHQEFDEGEGAAR